MFLLRAPAIGLLFTLLSACGAYSPHRALSVPTGFVSQQLCSAVFIAGLEPDLYYKEAIEPLMSPFNKLLSHHIDRDRRMVTTSFGGMATSSAHFRGAAGCTVTKGEDLAASTSIASDNASLLPPIVDSANRDSPVTTHNDRLSAALDQLMTEPASGPQQKIKAVVVAYRGQIVAERYAPGYGVHTPLHGWSMTKSVTNALIGILVRDSKIEMNSSLPIPEWTAQDARRSITPNHLIRMTSGLDNGNSLYAGAHDAVDFASQMIYVENDKASYARQAKAKYAPGTRFNYSNANTALLSRLIRDSVGGDGQSVLTFAHRELFDRIGMEHATFELDATGTPMGYSQLWASARDWTRFGMLYLNDGVIGGIRVLPEGWVDYSATLTPSSNEFGYGAGFWTNRGDSVGGRYRIALGIPDDALLARGSFGQLLAIIPSRQIVVTVLGYAFTDRGNIDATGKFIKEVLAVLPTSPLPISPVPTPPLPTS